MRVSNSASEKTVHAAVLSERLLYVRQLFLEAEEFVCRRRNSEKIHSFLPCLGFHVFADFHPMQVVIGVCEPLLATPGAQVTQVRMA